MVRDCFLQEVKPEQRQRSEHSAFIWNRVWQNHVEGGNPIRHDNQQLVFDRINISNLAASEKLDTREIRLSDYVNSRASSTWIKLSTCVELQLRLRAFVMALRIISMRSIDVKH